MVPATSHCCWRHEGIDSTNRFKPSYHGQGDSLKPLDSGIAGGSKNRVNEHATILHDALQGARTTTGVAGAESLAVKRRREIRDDFSQHALPPIYKQYSWRQFSGAG